VEDFEAWVQARSGALARTAYLLTGDVHLAEDLLQDTLARGSPTAGAGWHAPAGPTPTHAG